MAYSVPSTMKENIPMLMHSFVKVLNTKDKKDAENVSEIEKLHKMSP